MTQQWVSCGNGVRVYFVDANDEIPDNIVNRFVNGDDGHVYRTGVFETLKKEWQGKGIPDHIYVTAVERMEPLQ